MDSNFAAGGFSRLVSDAVYSALYSYAHALVQDGQIDPDQPPTYVDTLLQPLLRFTSAGKRSRAALCALSYALCSQSVTNRVYHWADSKELAQIGAGFELFQAAALAHDDIVDRAVLRRGEPALHLQFQPTSGIENDPSLSDGGHAGVSSAILAGDFLLSAAVTTFRSGCHSLGRDVDCGKAQTLFEQMTMEVALGQFLEVQLATRGGRYGLLDKEEIWRVLRHKSGRYSVRYPLTIGAVLAGAPAEVCAGLHEIGELWGEAFQLRDDYLGVFGNTEVTGKPVGDDIREGKRTILIALGLEYAKPEQRHRLWAAVGNQDLEAQELAWVQEYLRECGAYQAHELLIQNRLGRGLELLDALALPQLATQQLRDVGERLCVRSR